MKTIIAILLVVILLMLFCIGCVSYYDPYYYQTRHDRELNRKLDSISRELEQQAFDDRWDRLDRDLDY